MPQTSRHRHTHRLLAAAAGLATVGALAAAMPASAGQDKATPLHHQGSGRYQDVQLLSFNDLHGNLEPPTGSSGRVTELQADGTTKTVDAGGVEYLATHLREARKDNKYSITAAAGDMVGASPLISGLFHDEPTIDALNKLDLDVTSVGNHEFDEGAKELARLQNGGCHPKDGCYDDSEKFTGANFPTSRRTSPTRRPASRSSSPTGCGRRTASRSASSASPWRARRTSCPPTASRD